MTITEKLFALHDKKYAEFQIKLTPGPAPETFIGVRVPQCRSLAKNLVKESKTDSDVKKEVEQFLNTLPHKYYDENMLHGLILSELKDYEEVIAGVEKFLPYVDNWAVCDIMSPKVFKKHRPELLEKIRQWTKSRHTYTLRFGMEMLMSHFLDEDFLPEYLEIPALVRSSEYYVNMMTAWYFATALAKQWESAFPYIQQNRLDPWTHNKTIQKARESFRVSDEHKEKLTALKR